MDDGLGCHAGHQEVSRCCTQDESYHSPLLLYNPVQISLEVQEGVLMAPQKELVLQEIKQMAGVKGNGCFKESIIFRMHPV